MCTKTYIPASFVNPSILQGGEHAQNALSLWVVFRKLALQVVASLRKEICNLRHPMYLATL